MDVCKSYDGNNKTWRLNDNAVVNVPQYKDEIKFKSSEEEKFNEI